MNQENISQSLKINWIWTRNLNICYFGVIISTGRRNRHFGGGLTDNRFYPTDR